MQANPWFIRRSPLNSSSPKLRLYCFTYAGGSASAYLPWHRHLPDGVELCAVQLPGRGTRIREPLMRDFQQLLRNLLQVFSQETRLPFVFFGHSLGAIVAFELTRLARLHHLPQPRHLIVSGCEAPQFRRAPKNLHLLDDGPLIEALTAYEGTPGELMENSELMALALPIVRADFSLVADYTYRTAPKLDMPVTVFEGVDDHAINREHAHEWLRETTASCELQWFPGGHFFINSASATVIASLNRALAAYL
jgi:surfactin synthase thioesterase subunit